MKLRHCLPLLIFIFSLIQAHAQTSADISHYVVIGAFAKQDNAIRFTDRANKMNFVAQYAINPARQLYYVFILESPERRKAFTFMLKIRVETEFKDAWVFSGKLGIEAPPPAIEEEPTPQPEPVEEPPVTEEPTVEEPVEVEEVVEKEPEPEPAPKGKPFYFKLTSDGKDVLGEVHIQDSPIATQYQAFKGNEVVYLPAPRNTERSFIVAVQAPGYRPIDLTVNYDDPALVSSGIGSNNEVIIPVDLVLAKRGDYIEFNRVRFFGNSAIFDPQSKIELDGLAELMKENPSYKIRVHGHCNGKQSRNVVVKGTSTQFFETTTQNERRTVSAKELTQYRADLVKEYLVAQGIDSKRIKTKAEGGKVPIYPEGSTLASYNDRIEIEIQKGK